MKDLTKDDFVVFSDDDDEYLKIYCKTKYMNQILKNQEHVKKFYNHEIHIDEKGIKTCFCMAIYNPDTDVWIREELGNLLNFNKLRIDKQIVERLKKFDLHKIIRCADLLDSKLVYHKEDREFTESIRSFVKELQKTLVVIV